MNDRFQELTVFVRAAETGSFSAAGRSLGLSQPSVSRIVSDLEARLQTRLMLRTTRRIVPTEAGLAFLGRAKEALRVLEDAEETARITDSLSGLLRVALPGIIATRSVIPSLQGFLVDHPALKIELLTADTLHDLVAEGVDLAIRFGALEDSAFGARKVGVEPRMILASPEYLARKGTPVTVADLASHQIVAGPGGSDKPFWTLTQGRQVFSIKVDPLVRVASAESLLGCAIAGLGLTIGSTWAAGDALRSGRLVPVMTDYQVASVDVHAVFPGGPEPSRKTRLFTEHLCTLFKEL
jgi:DNA-binding transcriptional LysR family regulator